MVRFSPFSSFGLTVVEQPQVHGTSTACVSVFKDGSGLLIKCR